MSLILERSNSCPGEIWCEQDITNPGYKPPTNIPTWYEYWSALEFWLLRQNRLINLDNEINKTHEKNLFDGMTNEAKVRTYKYLVCIC